jgi:hypothetical protein
MAKSKPAVEELDDDDLELMDDEDEAPAKPAKGKAKSASKTKAAEKPAKTEKAESSGMGAAWLASHINEELGSDLTPANVRVILRKMANDGDFERAVGTDRARYSFTGEKDPIVRAVLKRVRSGEATRDKTEAIEAATTPRKNRKAAEAEDVEDVKPKAKRKKAADPEPEPERKPARRKRAE